MDDEENWDVISVEDIAGEFQIPWLAELIQRNERVNVNMDHVSGGYEENGENFHFMPIIEFRPMVDGAGFQLLHHHLELNDDGNPEASVYTFKKADDEPGYRVTLDSENHLAAEVAIISHSESEAFEDLPTYPPEGSVGNPWKDLDRNPTLER